MNNIKKIYYLTLPLFGAIVAGFNTGHRQEEKAPVHVTTSPTAQPAPHATQSVSAFAFALQNCFTGNTTSTPAPASAQKPCSQLTVIGTQDTATIQQKCRAQLQNPGKSCMHHAQAVYHPPLIVQKNAAGGDKVTQEVSVLEIVAQNCATFSGAGGCNGTMQADASMGPITQSVTAAGGHPNNLDFSTLKPQTLTPGKQHIRLPLSSDTHQQATNISYYVLKPTTGPLKGKEVEIVFQNLTAYAGQ